MQKSTDGRQKAANPIFGKSVGQVMSEAIEEGNTPQPERSNPVAAETGPLPLPVRPCAPEPEEEAEWPMPVEAFRKGNYLHCGDVVLTTKLGSLFSSLIRVIDHSDFAHSALVFLTPRADLGIEENYVIETTMGGLDIGAFGEFVAPTKIYADTGKAPNYIVGIKRLEREWATPELRARVSGRMLRFLDVDDYDYSMLAALASRYTKFWFRARNLVFGRAPSLGEYLRRGLRYTPAEFICSGFVQFAFVDMVRTAIERGLLPPARAEEVWKDTLFASWITEESTMEDLIGVRPAELAACESLRWKYLIFGGRCTGLAPLTR